MGTVTQVDVRDAGNAITIAVFGVVYVADLYQAVADHSGFVQSRYTAGTWAAFAAALANAEAIADRAGNGSTAAPVGQTEVDDAVAALVAAADALVAATPAGSAASGPTVALPRTGADLIVPAGGALALMLAGAGLMAVRRRGQVNG